MFPVMWHACSHLVGFNLIACDSLWFYLMWIFNWLLLFNTLSYINRSKLWKKLSKTWLCWIDCIFLLTKSWRKYIMIFFFQNWVKHFLTRSFCVIRGKKRVSCILLHKKSNVCVDTLILGKFTKDILKL